MKEIHLICELRVKPKIIGSKTENLSNGLFLRLEELLGLYLNNNDIHKDFSILRCIFRIGGHKETLVHQEEKEGAGRKVSAKRELSGDIPLSKHIPLRVSLNSHSLWLATQENIFREMCKPSKRYHFISFPRIFVCLLVYLALGGQLRKK